MPVWYKSKIKYEAVVDGKASAQSEIYLHHALNYGEVETQIPVILKTRVATFDEDTVDGINKIKFNDVLFHAQQDDDAFYQVKVTMFFDKKTKCVYLVPAIDYAQAGERMEEYLKGSLCIYEITHVDKSDVLAVWHPKNELWQGDWWNRMDRYYAEGKFEAGNNDVSEQQEIDFTKKADNDEEAEETQKLKEAMDYFGASEIKVTAQDKDGKNIRSVTLKSKPTRGITFRKKNGDPIDNER